jgi:hypothetical protein
MSETDYGCEKCIENVKLMAIEQQEEMLRFQSP